MSEDTGGIDAWVEQTTAFDRVRSVAGTVTRPRSVAWIADEAAVAENTARDHLDRLVELNVLLKHDREGTATYAPDPLHTRIQSLRELLEQHDRDELIRLKAEMQERVAEWREEYAVDSPEELRDLAAVSADAAETRDIRETASDWELVQYRLGIVEDAIENYETYSQRPSA